MLYEVITYATDELTNDSKQEGKTLRNKSLKDLVAGITGGDMKKFASWADPKSTGKNNEVLSYYADHKSATLVKNVGKDGKLDLKPRITSYNVCYTKLLRIGKYLPPVSCSTNGAK